MKTRKIFDCNHGGYHIIIEYHNGKINPYRIIRKWYRNGEHRKQLQKYADFGSCLDFIRDYYRIWTDPVTG